MLDTATPLPQLNLSHNDTLEEFLDRLAQHLPANHTGRLNSQRIDPSDPAVRELCTAKDSWENTLLHQAALNVEYPHELKKLATFLVRAGVDPVTKNSSGMGCAEYLHEDQERFAALNDGIREAERRARIQTPTHHGQAVPLPSGHSKP